MISMTHAILVQAWSDPRQPCPDMELPLTVMPSHYIWPVTVMPSRCMPLDSHA